LEQSVEASIEELLGLLLRSLGVSCWDSIIRFRRRGSEQRVGLIRLRLSVSPRAPFGTVYLPFPAPHVDVMDINRPHVRARARVCVCVCVCVCARAHTHTRKSRKGMWAPQQEKVQGKGRSSLQEQNERHMTIGSKRRIPAGVHSNFCSKNEVLLTDQKLSEAGLCGTGRGFVPCAEIPSHTRGRLHQCHM
jgi:hypothetical protein